jgi:hypothetical protein
MAESTKPAASKEAAKAALAEPRRHGGATPF